MKEFISFQNGILKTICKVYKHEDGRTLHLLPVIHVGEKRYYDELLEYIGEKICIYESIEIKVENLDKNEQFLTTPNTFDDWLEYNENLAEEMDKTLGSEIKRFQRKYKIFRGFTRRLRKLVKKNFGVGDNKLIKFYYQLERTNFALHNMTIQQNLLAEFLNLSFQYDAIDYFNDISNRKNWVHADVEVHLQDPSIEQAKNILQNPPPGFVELTKANAQQFYATLYLIETMVPLSFRERRQQMSEIFANLEQEKIPDQYVTYRNNIIIETSDKLFDEHDDIVVFYGAAHMEGIKIQAQKAGFELVSTKDFVAYRINEKE